MLKLQDKRRSKDRQLSTGKHTAWRCVEGKHSLLLTVLLPKRVICHVTSYHCLQVRETLCQRDKKHVRRAIPPSCGLPSPRHWPKPQRQLLNQGYFMDKKPIQEISECAEKMAQPVKCLPCNPEDLSSIPSTHVKSRAWQCVLILLGVWGREGAGRFP